EPGRRGACQALEPALERFVTQAHAGYVQALAARAARLLGAEPVGHEAVAPAPALGPLPGAGSGDPGGALSAELTETITVAVSTAVALAAGTVRGGMGHSLGLAIVSTLLHTTGPIGFLIGALGAFAVTAGLFDLSRESVGEWTKTVPLPAAALRLLLRDRKLESLVGQGRERAYAAVKAEVSADLGAVPARAPRAAARRARSRPAAAGCGAGTVGSTSLRLHGPTARRRPAARSPASSARGMRAGGRDGAFRSHASSDHLPGPASRRNRQLISWAYSDRTSCKTAQMPDWGGAGGSGSGEVPWKRLGLGGSMGTTISTTNGVVVRRGPEPRTRQLPPAR